MYIKYKYQKLTHVQCTNQIMKIKKERKYFSLELLILILDENENGYSQNHRNSGTCKYWLLDLL